jgi:hypothetical protein
VFLSCFPPNDSSTRHSRPSTGSQAATATLPADVAAALTSRSPHQRARCLRALVARIDYDGAHDHVAITLRENGRPSWVDVGNGPYQEKRA